MEYKTDMEEQMIISTNTDNIEMTKHAQTRASQRGIDAHQISFCMQFGEKFHRTGAVFYMITKKCLKRLKKSFGANLPRLNGIVVLGYPDKSAGFIVTTVYKNKNALSDIKQKKHYRS